MTDKEKLVIEYFLENPESYIGEVAEATGIPRSTVQRYLKKYSHLSLGKDFNLTIGKQLEINQQRGKVQGGRSSFIHNKATRDASGHFTGSVSDYDPHKEEKKQKDIQLICTYYLSHKSASLSEVADAFHELFDFSRDYVYDCLLDSRIPVIMGEDKANEIVENLEKNQRGFFRKLKEDEVSEEDLKNVPLTERERAVFQTRYQNPSVSLTQIAKMYGVSKTAIAKLEDSAIEKIRKGMGNSKHGS